MILANLRAVLFAAFPVVLILVFAVSRFIAGRSIAPIERVTATAERITSRTLDERIALPSTRDELHRLGDHDKRFARQAAGRAAPRTAVYGRRVARAPHAAGRAEGNDGSSPPQAAHAGTLRQPDHLLHQRGQPPLPSRRSAPSAGPVRQRQRPQPVLRDVDLREHVASLLAQDGSRSRRRAYEVTLHGEDARYDEGRSGHAGHDSRECHLKRPEVLPPGSPLEISFAWPAGGPSVR